MSGSAHISDLALTFPTGSSWAMVYAPACLISSSASAPSPPIPVSITPTALLPAQRAIERNSVSTEGRWRLTGASSLTRRQ